MSSGDDFHELYLQFGCCMASIVTEADGDEGIGGAFHVGDGVFVTARHVVDHRKIKEVRLTSPGLFYQSKLYPKNEDGSYRITQNSPRMCSDPGGLLTIKDGPFFHPNDEVDIAGFRVAGMEPGAHYVGLGGHLDDWVGAADFVLGKALVMGYPPIPFTTKPTLVAATGEINANVDLHSGGGKHQLHFVLSAMPRGGFSGGLAYSEYGFALGAITQSLVKDHQPAELGFFVTTSIEAIYVCLTAAGILPDCQKAGWEDLWEDKGAP